MTLPLFSVLHAVTHGPHSADPSDAEGRLWSEVVKKVCEVALKDERIILMTDANAHVHETECRNDDLTEHFRKALRYLQL